MNCKNIIDWSKVPRTDEAENYDINTSNSISKIKDRIKELSKQIALTNKCNDIQLCYFVSLATCADDYNRVIKILDDTEDMFKIDILNRALRQMQNYIETSLLYFERLLK